VTIRDRAAPRLTAPPATGNPRLDTWLRQVADALNALPNLSVFSYATPESQVTASAPALGFNLASATTPVWLKHSGDGNMGWVSVATDRAY
jgi:hypothetical protein